MKNRPRFVQTNRVITMIDEKLSFLFREKGDRGRAIGAINDLISQEARTMAKVMHQMFVSYIKEQAGEGKE